MTSIAALILVRARNRATILRVSRGLRPLAGLLVTSSGGPGVIVWVTLMCRRLLVESLLGRVVL